MWWEAIFGLCNVVREGQFSAEPRFSRFTQVSFSSNQRSSAVSSRGQRSTGSSKSLKPLSRDCYCFSFKQPKSFASRLGSIEADHAHCFWRWRKLMIYSPWHQRRLEGITRAAGASQPGLQRPPGSSSVPAAHHARLAQSDTWALFPLLLRHISKFHTHKIPSDVSTLTDTVCDSTTHYRPRSICNCSTTQQFLSIFAAVTLFKGTYNTNYVISTQKKS